MTAIEYLNQVYEAETKMKRIKLKIEHFEALANDMKLGYDERVQNGKADMDPAYAKYIGMKLDAERELEALAEQYDMIYKEVETVIAQVGGIESTVLYMKHINGYMFTQIAELKSYSYDGIRKIYDRGIEKIEEILANN